MVSLRLLKTAILLFKVVWCVQLLLLYLLEVNFAVTCNGSRYNSSIEIVFVELHVKYFGFLIDFDEFREFVFFIVSLEVRSEP